MSKFKKYSKVAVIVLVSVFVVVQIYFDFSVRSFNSGVLLESNVQHKFIIDTWPDQVNAWNARQVEAAKSVQK